MNKQIETEPTDDFRVHLNYHKKEIWGEQEDCVYCLRKRIWRGEKMFCDFCGTTIYAKRSSGRTAVQRAARTKINDDLHLVKFSCVI